MKSFVMAAAVGLLFHPSLDRGAAIANVAANAIAGWPFPAMAPAVEGVNRHP